MLNTTNINHLINIININTNHINNDFNINTNQINNDINTNINEETKSIEAVNTNNISEQIIYITYDADNFFNKYYYDYSNLFPGLNNEDLYTQIQNYILIEYSNSNEKNIIVKGESDFIYQITTSENEKRLMNSNISKKGYNISIIDFTECEQLFKKEYNISENASLILLKMERLTQNISEKNIQYQVYEPYNMSLLMLFVCENTVVKIYIPYTLTGETLTLYQSLKESGYDLFSKNDKFYNDICTPYTSLQGTDICLSSRQKYIYGQFTHLCQENCELSNYYNDTEYISCDCKINDEGIEPLNENKFNPNI